MVWCEATGVLAGAFSGCGVYDMGLVEEPWAGRLGLVVSLWLGTTGVGTPWCYTVRPLLSRVMAVVVVSLQASGVMVKVQAWCQVVGHAAAG